MIEHRRAINNMPPNCFARLFITRISCILLKRDRLSLPRNGRDFDGNILLNIRYLQYNEMEVLYLISVTIKYGAP